MLRQRSSESCQSATQALSVADEQAIEWRDDGFGVTLGPASSNTMTVDYAAADRTARAESDYTQARDTPTFARGETAKAVSVPVLDDTTDDGEKRFLLLLSSAVGAQIANGEAMGTIANCEPIPQAWTTRFGRTLADHEVDAA